MSYQDELDFLAYIFNSPGDPDAVEALKAVNPERFSGYHQRSFVRWAKGRIEEAGVWPTLESIKSICDEDTYEILTTLLADANKIVDWRACLRSVEEDYKQADASAKLQQGLYELKRGDVDLIALGRKISSIQAEDLPGWEERDLKEIIDGLLEKKPVQPHAGDKDEVLLVTGIDTFDDVLGTAPGTYGAICAMPGIGKTSLMLQFAAMSAKAGIKTMAMSLETDKAVLESKAAATLIKACGGNAYARTIQRSGDVFVPKAAAEAIGPDMLTIAFHPAGLPWSVLEAKIRSLHGRGYRLFMVDYFALLEPPVVSRDAKEHSMYAEMSKAVKALASELKCCIVLVVQPNGEVDYNEKPSPNKLGTTKQIFRDYDFGIFMWRDQGANDGYKAINGDHVQLLKAWVHKNRNPKRDDVNTQPEVWIEWEARTNFFRRVEAPAARVQPADARRMAVGKPQGMFR